MPVAVRPRPELLDDPGQLSPRRVDEPITERLRPGGLLLRIAGSPFAVLDEFHQRLLLVLGEPLAGILPRPGDRHVQMDRDAVAPVAADLRRDGRAPVATLCAVVVIAEPGHERVPGPRDLLDAPSGPSGLAREPVPGKRRAHHMEGILGASRRRID